MHVDYLRRLSQPYSPLWLENLPSEMQTLIIDNLSDDDMMTLRLVSKATREVVDKHWRPLKGEGLCVGGCSKQAGRR
jgi:hypothetical protein